MICIVTYYTLVPIESPDSFWMTRSQRSRRRNKGLWGLNNIIFILNQNTLTHNMLHFTAISITTWFILLQYPPQHGSLYCKIHYNLVHFTAISQHASFYYNTNHNTLHFTATCFILLQYQPQHASFYWDMLHFTGINLRRHSAETGLKTNQHVLNYLIIFKQRKEN